MKNSLAPGFKRFEFRNGLEGKWGGMMTEGDPSQNPTFRPRRLINCRIKDGEVRDRPGLTRLFEDPLQASSACIKNIVAMNCPTPKKLWIVTNGCPGVDPTTGYALACIDMEQDPEFQKGIYYNGATAAVVIGTFGGELYVGTGAELRKVTIVLQPWGTESLALGGTSQDIAIKTFTGYIIRTLQEFDGQLFIGLDNGAGASKVATFDGVSVRDDFTGINAPTAMGIYRIQNGGDAIVMGTSSGPIYIRAQGDSPLAWTSIGSATALEFESYKDVLYIADGAGNVRSWNGTTLAIARSPAGAVAVRCFAKANGYLFFGYETATAVIIGRYDGSSWTDVHKNITTQFAGSSGLRSLENYRGLLCGAGTNAADGRVWISPGSDTAGTWLQVTPAVSNNGACIYLLVA